MPCPWKNRGAICKVISVQIACKCRVLLTSIRWVDVGADYSSAITEREEDTERGCSQGLEYIVSLCYFSVNPGRTYNWTELTADPNDGKCDRWRYTSYAKESCEIRYCRLVLCQEDNVTDAAGTHTSYQDYSALLDPVRVPACDEGGQEPEEVRRCRERIGLRSREAESRNDDRQEQAERVEGLRDTPVWFRRLSFFR